MFERFTDRARKAMQLANQEAQRFNHEYVDTEHVLIGLLKEGNGVAAGVLKNLDVELRVVREAVERIVQHGRVGDPVVAGRLPVTPRTKKVLDYSADESAQLGHAYVGTEHLLLGLLREESGNAAKVLANLGLKLDGVRSEVIAILSPPAGEPTRKFTFTDGDAVSLMVELVTCGGGQGQVLTRWLKRTIDAVDGNVTKGAGRE
jgi:ATP-dependent Clp protease ATP-binding subunit ClpC